MPDDVPPPSPTAQPPPPRGDMAQRNRKVALLVSCLAVLVMAVFITLFALGRSASKSDTKKDSAANQTAQPTTCPEGQTGTPPACEAILTGEPQLVKTVYVSGLNNPWDMAFLPDETMFFTQRSGQINVRMVSGTVRELAAPTDVQQGSEGGMLGMAVDPDFAHNRYLYTCFSSNISGNKDNRLVRWTVDKDIKALSNRTDIVTGLPYSSGRHSGCRPRFGPDGYVWIGTGDVAVGTNAQNKQSLGGKVLRVDREGKAAPGNAGTGFDSRIYTYGHRNVQGLAFRPGTKQAYSIEHGTGVDDELNLLQAGKNYGWDPVPGYQENAPMTDLKKFPDAVTAVWSSGDPTIAPSGMTFLTGNKWRDWNGSIAAAVLKDEHLRIFTLDKDGTKIAKETKVLAEGVRLRSAVQGPDGNLYIATDVTGTGEIWKVVPR